ncbi:hypothetical protein [Brucella pseudintermedia]|uniref:hypothetical protein n=1 Tax=Brucella pseudintermedia TaxID=370111 RepID=UPI001F20AC34
MTTQNTATSSNGKNAPVEDKRHPATPCHIICLKVASFAADAAHYHAIHSIFLRIDNRQRAAAAAARIL